MIEARLLTEAISLVPPLTLIAIATLGFSPALKEKIREKWGSRCAVTGEYIPHIQIHHRVERCMGGANCEENGVPLAQDVHQYWDEHTRKTGEVFPGVPISEVPPYLFKNESVRQKVLQQFERGGGTIFRRVHHKKRFHR